MGLYAVGPDAVSQYKTLQAAFDAAEKVGEITPEFALAPYMMVDQPAISGLSNVHIRGVDPKNKSQFKSNREMDLNNAGTPVAWSSGLAKSKGILVSKSTASNWTIENLDISNAYVGSDYNACGIYFSGINITLRNLKLWDCQDGFRTSDQPQSIVNIENIVVQGCGATGGGKAHNIYIAPCKEVNIAGLKSYDAQLGHLLKLNLGDGLARLADIDLIASDYNDTSSYCLDINGGRVRAAYIRMRKGRNASNLSKAVYYATNRGLSPSGNSFLLQYSLIEAHCLHAGNFIVITPDTGDTITGDISKNIFRSVDPRWIGMPVQAPPTVAIHDNTTQLIKDDEGHPPMSQAVTLANLSGTVGG